MAGRGQDSRKSVSGPSLTSACAVAAARSIGKIGSAVISRYKPVGVARVGSPEERAQAYKRLLDATVHHRLNQSYVDAMKATTNAQQPLVIEAVRDLMASGAEMSSALTGVQLCAPEYVIAAGQAVTEAIQPDAEERTTPRNTPSMPTNHADALGNSKIPDRVKLSYGLSV